MKTAKELLRQVQNLKSQVNQTENDSVGSIDGKPVSTRVLVNWLIEYSRLAEDSTPEEQEAVYAEVLRAYEAGELK